MLLAYGPIAGFAIADGPNPLRPPGSIFLSPVPAPPLYNGADIVLADPLVSVEIARPVSASATSSAGSLRAAPAVALTGVSATGSAGTEVPAVSVTVSTTATPGSVGVTITVTTSTSATASAGLLRVTDTIILSGAGVSTAASSLVA